MRASPLVTAGAAVLLVGCTSDLLGPDFEDDFDRTGGCGDVVFFAVDRSDEVLLTFHAAGLVAEATSAAQEITTAFELPHAAVTLTVEVGSRISDAVCDDVIENGGPRIDRTYRAVSGRATVTIRPGPDAWSARGDLELRNVRFQDGDGHVVRVESLEWTDTGVGWLPG